jgi:hypothetical protein
MGGRWDPRRSLRRLPVNTATGVGAVQRAKLGPVWIRGVVAVCWVLGWALCAHAQPEHDLALQLHAPPDAGCIDARTLSTLVLARAGHAPALAGQRIEVEIAAHAQGYAAHVRLLDADGATRAQRELTTEDACAALDEMLVVAIASSLGVATPQEVTESAPAAAAPRSCDPDPELIPLPPTAAAPAATEPAPRWQLDLGVAASVVTGITPRLAFGPGIELLAQREVLALHVGGLWLPGTRDEVAPGLELRMTAALAKLGVCVLGVRTQRLHGLFCADAWGGAVRAAADPLWQPAPRWDGLLALAPRVALRLQLAASLGVAVGVGAAIPLLYPAYAYQSTSAARVRPHSIELGVFAELALWLRIGN